MGRSASCAVAVIKLKQILSNDRCYRLPDPEFAAIAGDKHNNNRFHVGTVGLAASDFCDKHAFIRSQIKVAAHHVLQGARERRAITGILFTRCRQRKHSELLDTDIVRNIDNDGVTCRGAGNQPVTMRRPRQSSDGVALAGACDQRFAFHHAANQNAAG